MKKGGYVLECVIFLLNVNKEVGKKIKDLGRISEFFFFLIDGRDSFVGLLF